MKVAYLLGSLNRGGTETLLLDVFRSAQSASFGIIGVHRHDGAYRDDFYQAGPPVYRLFPRHFGLLCYLLRLRNLLLREKVSVVHAQQAVDCLYAVLATAGTDIRVVETFHGFDFGAGKPARWLNRLSIRMADAVCFVSRAQRDYFIRRYALQKQSSKLHVVYNGVDFSKLDGENAEPDFLSANGPATAGIPVSHTAEVQMRRIRLAMVRNFVRGRAQSSICRSIKLLRDRGCTGFDFYFVGKRDEAEPWRYDDCVRYCRENGLENVHFLGGRGDVPAVLQHIDGFVYATDHDTFGIAVVEAMAAGIPVVVNDWQVMTEITHDGQWAALYRTGDDADCARAVSELLEHLADRKRKAAAIAPQVRAAYSIERHISRLAEIYDKIIH